MGNSQGCFSSSHKQLNKNSISDLPRLLSKTNNKSPSSVDSSSFSPPRSSMTKKKKKKKKQIDQSQENDDELALRNQAMAAAMMFREYQRTGGGDAAAFMMSRSASVVYPSPAPAKNPGFARSSSTRPRFGSESVVRPQELVDSQGLKSKIEGLETNHFVLVHGGGFGAWCWYKSMTLLEEDGFKVDAVDLTGFDSNCVKNLAQYVKPLTDIFDKLDHGKKVILVGHDFGGACVSYVMELFPSRISRAIFVAATMLATGQSTLDFFTRQIGKNDMMHQAQTFVYANGKDKPPTAIDHNKEMVKDLFFNQSPSKDVALASLSMRPMPFAPIMEKLSLSDSNYGSVRRFYVVTQDDRAVSAALQDTMIESDPPERVFRVKGSDHSPFFSRPQALHKIFLEIAQIPPK